MGVPLRGLRFFALLLLVGLACALLVTPSLLACSISKKHFVDEMLARRFSCPPIFEALYDPRKVGRLFGTSSPHWDGAWT